MIFTCFAAAAGTNSSWFTRVWQTDDGLPNNQVTAILQGQDGFLWIGTTVGLARFDGIRFSKFSYSTQTNNEDQGVSDLLPASSGGMWIRMRRGPLVLLRSDFSPEPPTENGLPTKTLAAIEDREGSLWVASPDSIWRMTNGQATAFCSYQNMRASGFAGGFAADSDGNLWVAKGNSVYILRDGKFGFVTNTIYRAHLAASRSNGIWIASGKQLFKCLTNGTLQDFGSFSPPDAHAGSTVVMEDHAGVVWIGTTTSGLFRYDNSGFERIEMSHPNVLCLAEDKEGNIWAGTAGGGLDRISPRSVQLEGLETGSSLSTIQSICEDVNGVQWGATQSGLLVCRQNGKWTRVLTNAPWTSAVDCVAADTRGTLWIGTRNSGLYSWREGQFENWSTNRGFAGHVVLDLLPTSTGDLWIAELAPISLQCLHEGKLRSVRVPRAIGRITALAEDSSGTIWIGSETGALMRMDGDRLTNEISLARSILGLHTTTDGALWICSEGAGLGRIRNGHFDQLTTEQGFFDDYISQMVSDDQGWFWFGGERGIFKVRREELESVMNTKTGRVRSIACGKNEGLFSMEAASANVSPYISPGTLRGREGQLWIPMRKALAVVDPKIMRTDPNPPEVLLSKVTVDGRILAAPGGGEDSTVVNLATLKTPLQLPPAHRHLEFDFTAIHFAAPENIRFRYQLMGYENDWIDATAERKAEYSRLPAGNYQFRAAASIGDGPWSLTPITFGFSVQPFLWQTSWFRVGALLIFTSSLIALVRYISFRRLQQKMRFIEQRAALDKERTRIARDLHDDLGCSLNKVALTLDMTQRELESAKPLNGEILHCSSMVRQAAKSVDEIVWAINPRNDTLPYMVDYISQFAVEFLHAADISCRVDLPENVPNGEVSPEVRHNLYLVVKEALNNIARHAQAREVRLTVVTTADHVEIVIQDNGRGFESGLRNASGDGLHNMRQRMAEIGGRFQLESQPGTGTRVAFFYSWPVPKEK